MQIDIHPERLLPAMPFTPFEFVDGPKSVPLFGACHAMDDIRMSTTSPTVSSDQALLVLERQAGP